MASFFRRERTVDPRVAADPHRQPPGQVLTDKWPVLTYGRTPRYDMKAWRLRLFGEVENPVTMSWEELLALPRVEVTADMHCVTTWSRLDNRWEGVAFKTLTDLVHPRPGAAFVIAHCDAGYTTSLPVEVLADSDVLLAYRHDGVDLPDEHGGPLRLVVPKRYAWKSAKWLEGLEWAERDRLGFWERNGYNNSADPWLEERYW
jgi:DMSO/TMAO reductase YedYZ molybdopterin-dependent catalytic subunit